jgi:formyltetrahydrofolate deformylase
MIIVIQCKDKVGLVAAISGVLANENINIISMREYVDTEDNLFFARVEIEKTIDSSSLEKKLQHVLPVDAIIKIDPLPGKKIVVLVTKEYHCLADILIRDHFNTLGAGVQCVIGNHRVLENICSRFDIPFHFVSHEEKTRDIFEQEIADIISTYQCDYMVLAKFMRILSPQVCSSSLPCAS